MNKGHLQVLGIEKSYRDAHKRVLSEINFSAKPGEFVVIVGPSGCGKSTLLRVIAGLESAQKGQVILDDHDLTFRPPQDRGMAMVFQDYALYPHKTVYENMAFCLKIRKWRAADIDQRVREVARQLDLLDLLERRPSALSGGQKQRVAIGRALVRHPTVFLFDEPLSNLDAQLRSSMRMMISQLHKQLKTTMLYVTHDQVEAMTLADQILVLNQGIIQQKGPPLTLYERPANCFVAQFLGSPSMRLISGTLVQDGGWHFVGDGVSFRLPISCLPQLKKDIKNGDQVFWGLRAEDLILAGMTPEYQDASQETALSFSLHIDFIEPLGSQSLVYAKLGGSDIVVSVPGHAVNLRQDDDVTAYWPARNVYLFSQTTGESLLTFDRG